MLAPFGATRHWRNIAAVRRLAWFVESDPMKLSTVPRGHLVRLSKLAQISGCTAPLIEASIRKGAIRMRVVPMGARGIKFVSAAEAETFLESIGASNAAAEATK